MTKEQIFQAWSPESSLWARWAKPVLFAHVYGTDSAWLPQPAYEAPLDLGWIPPVEQRAALVLDLPGAEGAHLGALLAVHGYQPVPLYNAVPGPYTASVLGGLLTAGHITMVDVYPIIEALRQRAAGLAALRLPPYAPPVFLLDSNRHGPLQRPRPGDFDNRSVSFVTDFPSTNFLLANGIQRVLLVQRERVLVLHDLGHTLRRWQDGGVRLERFRLDQPGSLEPFELPKPSWYGTMFQRALAAFGLRRGGDGGFGDWMPDSSAVG